VNPVEFENLEDYTEFLEWQRSQGIRCPVLYLQQSFDAQGERVFKVRPDVTELQGGTLPSCNFGEETAYYDTSILEEIHDDSQYQMSTLAPSDQILQEIQAGPISPDPMDPNWGGAEYTQSLVDKGYYKENEVQLRV
jgi:hypothetical protein